MRCGLVVITPSDTLQSVFDTANFRFLQPHRRPAYP